MTTILAPIGSLLFSFGIVLVFVAGWMRLCDSGSDLAGRVLGAGVTLLLLGWMMSGCAGTISTHLPTHQAAALR